MNTKHQASAVSAPVWLAVFIGFAMVAVGYFVGLLSPASVGSRWLVAAIGGGLAMMVLALPIQYLYDLRHDRFPESRGPKHK